MQFMFHFNICYAKNLQNLDDCIFIPATLDAKLLHNKRIVIANGKRKLHWPIPPLEAPKNPIFLGHRLECNDQFHTFLTLGFFPQLRVNHKYILFSFISHYFELIQQTTLLCHDRLLVFIYHPILLKINIGSNVGHMVHIRTCKWELLCLIQNCFIAFFS